MTQCTSDRRGDSAAALSITTLFVTRAESICITVTVWGAFTHSFNKTANYGINWWRCLPTPLNDGYEKILIEMKFKIMHSAHKSLDITELPCDNFILFNINFVTTLKTNRVPNKGKTVSSVAIKLYTPPGSKYEERRQGN